jgi:sarcosine oxidase subunit beta
MAQPALQTEILIVGAGVLGAGSAWRLARAGKRVVLADRGDVGREASGSNAGGIQLVITAPELLPYELEARRLWDTLGNELGTDLELVPCGGLRVAETDADLSAMAELMPAQRALGLDVRLLSRREAVRLVPALSPGVAGAIFCAQDAYAASRLVPAVLAQAASQAGAAVLPFHPVHTITRRSSGFLVRAGDAEIEADVVVDAAGAWAGQVAAMAGITLPVAPDIQQVHVTDPLPPLLPHIYSHADKNLTIKQFRQGNVVIGGGRTGLGGPDEALQQPTLTSTACNLADAVRLFPALRGAHLLRSWAGVEGRSPDQLPYLGPVTPEGDFFVLACSKCGFSLNPILTLLLSELILRGRTSLPVGPFAPIRYADRSGDASLFAWLARKRFEQLRDVPRLPPPARDDLSIETRGRAEWAAP